MTEAYLPPIPDPVITDTARSRIATDPEGRARRRSNGRGLNAFVIVKPTPDGGIDAETGCGPVTPIRPVDAEAAPAAEAAEAADAPDAMALLDAPEAPPPAAGPTPEVTITFVPPTAAARPAPPPAALPPAPDPLQLGQVVAEAFATAVAAQSDLAERYLAAARRIDELEARLTDLGRERDAAAAAFADRVRAMEAEREAVMVDLVARIHGLEAERDHMAEALRTERDRRLVEAAELLADVLTPRLCGVLDEHTGMADRYAAAAQRVGGLEAQVARLTDQVNGARAWRQEFDELERAAAVRPWWKFWG